MPPSPGMFRSLAIASSGLSAQRVRMETIATNIANAETTHDVNGTPYRRRVALLAAGDGSTPAAPAAGPVVGATGASGGPFGGTDPFNVPAPGRTDSAPAFEIPVLQNGGAPGSGTGVHVAGVVEDATPGQLVYDPGHPDADKNGYVRYPNVRITDEMVDMMDARRVYEANATVFQSAKAMLRRAIDI